MNEAFVQLITRPLAFRDFQCPVRCFLIQRMKKFGSSKCIGNPPNPPVLTVGQLDLWTKKRLDYCSRDVCLSYEQIFTQMSLTLGSAGHVGAPGSKGWKKICR
jgi:hypothetical protein